MRVNLRSMVRSDRGVSEMALVVSIAIVALMTVAVMTAVSAFSKSTAQASMESQAADAAQSVFELANATPWSDLAMSDADPDLSDPNVVALADGQPFVTLDPGEFEDFAPTRAVVTDGTENFGTVNDRFTVYTAVTWEDQPAVSAVSGDTTATFGTKKISVLVVWADGERGSQSFSSLRSPTIAEAVPSSVNVVSGGGLTVERDTSAPVLVGDSSTGDLSATISDAYRWQIQMSANTSWSSFEILCGSEYSEVRSTVEDCNYKWKGSIGLNPSFRVKVWTHDKDDSASSASGIKYSNVVTFPGPSIQDLTGGKTAWNKEQIFWPPTDDLLEAHTQGATVTTVVTRRVTGNPNETVTYPYNTSGGSHTFTALPGESATYRVCTHLNGTSAACSGWFGPLYTIDLPDAPTVTGVRPAGAFVANFSWSSNADSYTGPGGTGVTFDVERKQADGSWTTEVLDTTTTSMASVAPYNRDGSSYKQTTVSLRVRVKNDSGFSPWAVETVTVGELPTTPSLSVSSFTDRDNDGNTEATFTWTKGSYAYEGWRYELPHLGNSYTVGPNDSRSREVEGPTGTTKEFKVRGENQFGVSNWASLTITHEGPPTNDPSKYTTELMGGMRLTWDGLSNATGYEVQYQVNGSLMRDGSTSAQCTSNSSTPGSTISWCTSNSSTRSQDFTNHVNEGDVVIARVRGYNEWGAGPWSPWSSDKYALMRDVGNLSGFSGDPHISGGRYTWNALSCDSGSQAQYTIYDGGSWSSWQTSRSYVESFGYGQSGSVKGKQRCINTTSNYASQTSGGGLQRDVGWRLLPVTANGGDYNEAWNSNNWRRVEQETLAYFNSPGRCGAANTAPTIDGSGWGGVANQKNPSDTTNEIKVFQCWLNYRDGGQSANISTNGVWDTDTTHKLKFVLEYRCGGGNGQPAVISIDTTTYPTNYFDNYEMHRFTTCLNAGAV